MGFCIELAKHFFFNAVGHYLLQTNTPHKTEKYASESYAAHRLLAAWSVFSWKSRTNGTVQRLPVGVLRCFRAKVISANVLLSAGIGCQG